MDKPEFFGIHRLFTQAYSDLVVFTVEKPFMVLIEQEAAYMHLMKYEMGEDPESNFKKAKGHIYRATLDRYKQLWVELRPTISEMDRFREAYEGNESDLLSRLKEMGITAEKARLNELESVGQESIGLLELWKEVIDQAMSIYRNINKSVLHKSKSKARYSGTFSTYIYPIITGIIFLAAGFAIGKII